MTSNVSGEELRRRAAQGAADGLNLVALRVQALAVPLTPIDEGDLRSSLVVGEASPQELTSQVGSDLPYAVRQHEELDYHHPRGGQAKFLEAAVLRAQPQIEQIMAQAMRRRMGA